MTEGKGDKITVDDLLMRYAEAAAAHGRYSLSGDYERANPQAEVIADIYRELRSRGREAQVRLAGLLDHADEHVRAWAAAHALEFSPDAAESVLSELAENAGIVGLNAKVTLREWQQGTLRFP